MNKISTLSSSSTQLALFFSVLVCGALAVLYQELHAVGAGVPMDALPVYASLCVILAACSALFFISFYVTKRINRIVATADQIIQTRDLTRRIPIDNPWDDLSKLARVLNAMLTQIEQSVANIRQVSDNISHDLRTPLTRLRNHIETMRMQAVTHPTPARDQQENFNGLIHECDALLGTFNALLRIANIESGRGQATFMLTDLHPVVEDVIALYEPIAAEKSIRVTWHSAPSWVTGDKDLLFQMLANLIDNAIKYTPTGGTISLELDTQEQRTQITIRDSGAGIPDSHKGHVFRRFYRVESARSTPGSGLGLSLVHAIVSLHGGLIALTDNQPNGLVVTVVL